MGTAMDPFEPKGGAISLLNGREKRLHYRVRGVPCCTCVSTQKFSALFLVLVISMLVLAGLLAPREPRVLDIYTFDIVGSGERRFGLPITTDLRAEIYNPNSFTDVEILVSDLELFYADKFLGPLKFWRMQKVRIPAGNSVDVGLEFKPRFALENLYTLGTKALQECGVDGTDGMLVRVYGTVLARIYGKEFRYTYDSEHLFPCLI